MQVLLDECLPTALRHELAGYDARSVKFMGWSGIDNGRLLRLMAEAGFQAFVTIDQNLCTQQDLREAGVAVVQLRADSNRLEAILPLVPAILAALDTIKPGERIVVPAP
ncbi:MAG TPA: hypothetical protein PLU35_07845 [Phycisphaerales bacterium]|nr:hypothetical protein [Phycisphaerales bacterium]